MIRLYAHNNPLTCADELFMACTLTSVDLFLSRAYTLTLVSVHLFYRERKLIYTAPGNSKRRLGV